MNGKQAKRLRRLAEERTVGQSEEKTKLEYREMKVEYKSGDKQTLSDIEAFRLKRKKQKEDLS